MRSPCGTARATTSMPAGKRHLVGSPITGEWSGSKQVCHAAFDRLTTGYFAGAAHGIGSPPYSSDSIFALCSTRTCDRVLPPSEGNGSA